MAIKPPECTFIVKEDEDNRAFIAIEPSVAGLDIAFRLIDGVHESAAGDLSRDVPMCKKCSIRF